MVTSLTLCSQHTENKGLNRSEPTEDIRGVRTKSNRDIICISVVVIYLLVTGLKRECILPPEDL